MAKKVTLESCKKRARSEFASMSFSVTKEDIKLLKEKGIYRNGFSYLDLSEYDFSNITLEDLLDIPFSSSTKWPSKDKLPVGFNPEVILDKGNMVSEDIRNLHSLDIDGRGITVAVIDSYFQGENHIEFEGANIKRVSINNKEEYGVYHIENVLAKLVGKNMGVAPGANVLCYEVSSNNKGEQYLMFLKKILRRVKNNEEIRVVNISAPLYNFGDEEYIKECHSLIEELKKYNCEVENGYRERKKVNEN